MIASSFSIQAEQQLRSKTEARDVECVKKSFICLIVSTEPHPLFMDWLSRLFEMMPVRGRVDLRCLYGAPWRIEQGPAEVGEIPYCDPAWKSDPLRRGIGVQN
jgi:hypothetical protein